MTSADFVIITALPEEFDAVCDQIPGLSFKRQTIRDRNIYSWKEGYIDSNEGGRFSVALCKIGESGETSSGLATDEAIRLWKPKYVFFVGIAGGFDVEKGDVIIAREIYGYDYGKLDNNFIINPSQSFRCDMGLINCATTFHSDNKGEWKTNISIKPPHECVINLHVEDIASGNKVVDNPTNPFFRAVLNIFPKIKAVEMEGVGACQAINKALSKGKNVNFLMVRGVSDIPRKKERTTSEKRGTEERDLWKKYASATAATFVVSWIKSGILPISKSIGPSPSIVYPRSIFLDALDSSRSSTFTNKEIQSLINEVYIKAQFVLAFIMGDLIIVSENQFFDSYGFLETVDQILKISKTIKINTKVSIPIRIALRENSDVFLTVAKHFRNDKFALSLWKNLNGSTRRHIWASAIEKREIPALNSIMSDEFVILEKLWNVLEYFTPDKCIRAKSIPEEFSIRINKIINLNDNQIDDLYMGDKKYLHEICYCDAAKDIRDLLKEINHKFGPIKDRSRIREALKEYKNESIKQGVIELTDNIYNQTLGIATNASLKQNSFFPSNPNDYIISGFCLSTYIQDLRNDFDKNCNWFLFSFDYFEDIERIDYSQTVNEVYQILENANYSVPWEKLILLQQSSEWRKKLNRFNNCLNNQITIEKDLSIENLADEIKSNLIIKKKKLLLDLIKYWNSLILYVQAFLCDQNWQISPNTIYLGKNGLRPINFNYQFINLKFNVEDNKNYQYWKRINRFKGWIRE
jgi:nucleoside phosphorylase